MRTLLGQFGALPWLSLSVALGGVLGCGTPAAARPVELRPAVAPTPVSEPTLADRGWGVLRSKALGLKLALPEAKAWLVPETSGKVPSAWELRHEPTASTLSLRRWRAARLPQVEQCERELRQRVPNIPEVDESNLVSVREVRVPAGFVTRLTLLSLPGKATRLSGRVLAVGAGIGECLAAVVTTECSSELELAERLRLFDAALGHIRLSHVEDRVPAPQPLAP